MIKTIIIAAMLLTSASAYAQYQGSVQPNGTGGYNTYGADGRFTGSAQPNGTGGYNIYTPPPPTAVAPRAPTGFMPLPCAPSRPC